MASDEKKPKMWIYRGDACACAQGLGPHLHVQFGFVRFEHIPDDVVLVPREKIKALEKKMRDCELTDNMKCQSPYQPYDPPFRETHREEYAIIACLYHPMPKPKDAILAALKDASSALYTGRGSDAIGAEIYREIQRDVARAITLRESELREQS